MEPSCRDGGKRLSEEDAVAVYLYRKVLGMSRADVAKLPKWERELLLAGARSSEGFDRPPDGANASVMDIITTRSDGG